MATYLILNIIFMLIVIAALRIKPKKPSTNWWIALAILLLMTAVFDSLIIAANIVEYNIENILGIYIFRAPIEDFAYIILAMIIIPVLWNKFKDREK